MAQDGTYSTICTKWFGYPTNEALIVDNLARAQQEVRRRTAALFTLAAAIVLLLLLARRLRSARRTADRATAAKPEFLANTSWIFPKLKRASWRWRRWISPSGTASPTSCTRSP